MRGAKQKEMFEISDLRRREIRLSFCPPVGGFGGGGGVLLYIHTYVGSGYFGGFKILNFNIFGGFQKILWILFGGHHKIGLYLEVISMQFRVFSEDQGTECRICFGLLKVHISIWGA